MKNVFINTSNYISSVGLLFILKELNCNLHLKIIDNFDDNIINECDFLLVNNKSFELLKISQLNSKTEVIIIDDKEKNLLSITSKQELLEHFSEIFCSNKKSNNISNDISERERQIIKLVATGYTNKQIADELFLSIHTVITHRKNISAKLGIKTISGLTIYAVLNEIIKLPNN